MRQKVRVSPHALRSSIKEILLSTARVYRLQTFLVTAELKVSNSRCRHDICSSGSGHSELKSFDSGLVVGTPGKVVGAQGKATVRWIWA
jgi:hypothetical protein